MTHRKLTLVAGIGFSALFLWIAVRDVDVTALRLQLATLNLWAAIPYIAVLLLFFATRAHRWKLLLSPMGRFRARDLFAPLMIGYGANFLLPFQLGEVARSAAAKQETGLPFMSIAGTIVIERILDYLLIMAALSWSLVSIDRLPDFVKSIGLATGAIVALLVLVVVLFAKDPERTAERFNGLAAFLPGSAREFIAGQLAAVAGGFSAIRSPAILLFSAASTIIQWVLLALCISIALNAASVEVSISTVTMVMVLLVLVISIPNAPAYIGSVQAAYVVGVEMTGGDPTSALSASLFHHLLFGITSLTLGGFYFFRFRNDRSVKGVIA